MFLSPSLLPPPSWTGAGGGGGPQVVYKIDTKIASKGEIAPFDNASNPPEIEHPADEDRRILGWNTSGGRGYPLGGSHAAPNVAFLSFGMGSFDLSMGPELLSHERPSLPPPPSALGVGGLVTGRAGGRKSHSHQYLTLTETLGRTTGGGVFRTKCQKRPTQASKETYTSAKRDLPLHEGSKSGPRTILAPLPSEHLGDSLGKGGRGGGGLPVSDPRRLSPWRTMSPSEMGIPQVINEEEEFYLAPSQDLISSHLSKVLGITL